MNHEIRAKKFYSLCQGHEYKAINLIVKCLLVQSTRQSKKDNTQHKQQHKYNMTD